MWKHRLAALSILLACVGLWVGTALYRAHSAEAAVHRRLDQLADQARARGAVPRYPDPDIRADRKALLLNPFLKNPPVYLYRNGRPVFRLEL